MCPSQHVAACDRVCFHTLTQCTCFLHLTAGLGLGGTWCLGIVLWQPSLQLVTWIVAEVRACVKDRKGVLSWCAWSCASPIVMSWCRDASCRFRRFPPLTLFLFMNQGKLPLCWPYISGGSVIVLIVWDLARYDCFAHACVSCVCVLCG